MGVEAATLRAQPTTFRHPTTVARAAPIAYATLPYPFNLQNPLSQSQPHICYSSLGTYCCIPPQRLQRLEQFRPELYDTFILCPIRHAIPPHHATLSLILSLMHFASLFVHSDDLASYNPFSSPNFGLSPDPMCLSGSARQSPHL